MKRGIPMLVFLISLILILSSCADVPYESSDSLIWNGSFDTEWYDSTLNEFEISTPEQLAGLAKLVNDGTTFEKRTVNLVADIDLGNKDWTPIGTTTNKDKCIFRGIFDGNDKVISNLKVNQDADIKAAGLFGAMNGTVKNLTIDGANIKSISKGDTDGATTNGIAVLAGSLYPSGIVENVKINNFTVTGNRYVGGIAGYSTANKGTSIINCSVENGSLVATPDNLTGSYDNGDKVGGIIGYCVYGDVIEENRVSNVSLKGYRDIGGIIGYRDTAKDNPQIVLNNSATDITITIDGEHNYKNYTDKEEFSAGPIIGDTNGSTIDESNTHSGYKVEYINFTAQTE